MKKYIIGEPSYKSSLATFFMNEFRSYIDAFLTLFIVFDAIGNVPIFYSLTSHMNEKERNKVFYRSTVIAGGLLILLMYVGVPLINFYGLTLDDLRIAGGLMLLLISLTGVFGRLEANLLVSEDIAVVPMATPLLAGPGSIYTVIYLNSMYGALPTLVSILSNTLIAIVILKYSNMLLSKLGKNLIIVLSRIMSFILAVLAVSMLREGFINIAKFLREK